MDQEILSAIQEERQRQKNNIELIASENFVSKNVLSATGSILTNKYAEGYPGRRYYGGCDFVDKVENIAIERAKKLFDADHVNVQPHSGAQANMAVYFSVLEPGDTVLGMSLAHGGHLTHGSAVNYSGKLYNFVPYEVDPDTCRLDYDKVYELMKEHKPKLLVAGASSYSRAIDFKRLSEIAKEFNTLFMVDMAHIAGLVCTGFHQNPVPYADFVTTTTHKTLRGPRGGMILCKEQYAKMIDKAVFPGMQGGPLMHVIAGKAVAFGEALTEDFKEYISNVVSNAKALAESLNLLGVDLVAGGTDNHLLMIDLRSLGLTGKEAEKLLDDVGITTNKNAIPFDPQSPFITSGIRIGTPAVTSRGMDTDAMKVIASVIYDVLKYPQDDLIKEKSKTRVLELTNKYDLPGL